jgi:hypothetical protein
MSDSVPSGGQWLSDTVGASTGLVSMPIFKSLEIYRKATLIKPATAELKEMNRQLRLSALTAVVEECIRLSKTTTSAAQIGVLYKYAGLCLKRSGSIRDAAKHWGTATSVFKPSYAGNPTARAAQRIGFTPKAKTLSDHDYWLEKLDPKHHSWRQPELMALFTQWEQDAQSPLNLWDWLEKNGSPAAAQLAERVVYMAPDRRWENCCTVDDKSLVHKLASATGTAGDLLWTKRSNAARVKTGLFFYHPSFWAYVISPGGGLYVHHHEADHFHHSSFLGGDRVLGAGMIGVSQGRIVYINNKSGHYTPTPEEFYRAIKALKLHHTELNIDDALVEVIMPGAQSWLAWGKEWLAKNGDFRQFEGPLPTSDDKRLKVGWARGICAQMIEAGECWADVPVLVRKTVFTSAEWMANRVELGFLDMNGQSSSEWVARGGQQWNALRARGWRTEAEQPSWFF